MQYLQDKLLGVTYLVYPCPTRKVGQLISCTVVLMGFANLKGSYPAVKTAIAIALVFFWVEEVWKAVSLHGWLYLYVGVVGFYLAVYGVRRGKKG